METQRSPKYDTPKGLEITILGLYYRNRWTAKMIYDRVAQETHGLFGKQHVMAILMNHKDISKAKKKRLPRITAIRTPFADRMAPHYKRRGIVM